LRTRILVFTAALLLLSQSSVAAKPTESLSQIDEIFVWKVSDELQLSLKKEKELSKLISSFSSSRSKIILESDQIIQKLAQEKSPKQREVLIAAYKKTVKQLNEISLQEIDGAQKVLGTENLGAYLSIKQKFAERVKDVLLKDRKK
jgi:hypothetical protein